LVTILMVIKHNHWREKGSHKNIEKLFKKGNRRCMGFWDLRNLRMKRAALLSSLERTDSETLTPL